MAVTNSPLPVSALLPPYPYVPRLTVKGRIYLQCPSCGLITINKLIPGQFTLQCYDEHHECRHRLYGFGFRLFPITRGRRAAPPDHVTVAGLREAFPVGEMFRWKSGEMTHQLVPGGRELARELVRQVRNRTGVGGLVGLGAAFEQVVAEWGLEGVENE